MPFNGSGTFNPLITFVPNTEATAEDQNTQDTDFAGGLTNCVTRDGQGVMQTNFNANGFQVNHVANGTASTDAVNFGQLTSAINQSTPSGSILLFGGASAPSGFFMCDGTAISRTTYSVLFAVIGTTYGVGDGSTTFNLPDLRGRAPIGYGTGSGLTTRTIGSHGGEETHLLTTPEIPSHTHTDSGHTHTDAGHTHGPGAGSLFITSIGVNASIPVGGGIPIGNTATTTATGSASIQTGTANIQNTGGGCAHNNMQPWLAVNFIIKT